MDNVTSEEQCVILSMEWCEVLVTRFKLFDGMANKQKRHYLFKSKFLDIFPTLILGMKDIKHIKYLRELENICGNLMKYFGMCGYPNF